jgi:hypothetical protein
MLSTFSYPILLLGTRRTRISTVMSVQNIQRHYVYCVGRLIFVKKCRCSYVNMVEGDIFKYFYINMPVMPSFCMISEFENLFERGKFS